jgi:hypothetical protein
MNKVRRSFGYLLRVLAAALLLVLSAAYTRGVITGTIGKDQRIDATHLIALVMVVAVSLLLVLPDLTKRLKTFELQGFKLELEKVRERQQRQEVELEDVRLLIPLLLPDPERELLTDLATRTGTEITGGDRRRAELRKLTSLNLLRRNPGRNIGDLKDGQTMLLADLLHVTPLGEQWVRRLKQLEAQKPDLPE